MGNILQIGYATEGTTDLRFLGNIIQKTFENIALDCQTEIEVYQPESLKKEGATFVEQVTRLVSKYHYFHIICIHADSDSNSIANRMRCNFNPAFREVELLPAPACKNLVAIIPVHMTEAWMLADIDLLKIKMGSTLTNEELGLPAHSNLIESLRNPKRVISEALRIGQETHPRRRKKLNISNLYSPISQELTLARLNQLPSFRTFVENARIAMAKLNYLNL
jgi:hypothetical protein